MLTRSCGWSLLTLGASELPLPCLTGRDVGRPAGESRGSLVAGTHADGLPLNQLSVEVEGGALDLRLGFSVPLDFRAGGVTASF